MKVSTEITSLKPYQPGKPISETRREYGLDEVYKLASNENPLGPSPKVLEALAQAAKESHRYPDASCFELRQSMAKHYGVDKDRLAFGNGSNELIDLLIRIYCEPGSFVLTGASSFIAYKICAQAARVKPVEIPLKEDFSLDLPAMAEWCKEHHAPLIFIPNPNNPTGAYVKTAELEEFLKQVQGQDSLVVLDEAYCEFVRAEDYPDALKLMKTYKNVVSLRTLSKVYGLAGLRLGVFIGDPEVVDLIDRVRNPFNVNSLAQAAGVAALTDTEYLRRAQQVNWQGLDYFYQEFSRLGLKYWPSQGNFVLFDTAKDAAEVALQLLKKGLIVRPVKGYGLNSQLRLSVGLPEENEFAIKCIEDVLKG